LSSGNAAELERVRGGLSDFNRIMCASAPGGRLVELEGVVAAVMPATPERSMMNAVVYERPHALASALGELAATYAEAGVEAWVVLAPAVDGEAKRLLRRSGHARVASTQGMARRLDGLERPPRHALEEWIANGDPAAMAAICDRAFSFGTAFTRALSGLPRRRARVYLASLDGQPVSCVMTSDHEGNCAVDLTATLPEAQGRGLSGALLAHALADAAERGCESTTVVASPVGECVYERLGYRAVCPIQHWVRRAKLPMTA
jgi:GNAT superfamily N-acetyltransferase